MQKHNINVVRSVPYYTLGDLNSQTKNIWLVLHGYGQLAKYFIQKFKVLADLGDYVVAPEALSKFYIDHEHKRVGASWMTKEDRLLEIEDYINYLNQLYALLPSNNCTVHVLGFSQGVATACRWVKNTDKRIDHLWLWSGSLPTDLDSTAAGGENSFQTHHVYGLQDPYLKTLAASSTVLKKFFFPHRIHTFDGGHEIIPNELAEQRAAF